jgi:hypothetical protein
MKEEKKVVHEVKLDKSIIKLLWVFAVVLLLNAVPKDMLIPEAFAELSSNPVITLLVGEMRGGCLPYAMDECDDGIDIDN